MKLRISNYKVAYFLFKIIGFLWNKILGRGILFNKMEGLDFDRNEKWGYKKLIDEYYLLWFK